MAKRILKILVMFYLIFIFYACQPKTPEQNNSSKIKTEMTGVSDNIRISQTKSSEIQLNPTNTPAPENSTPTPGNFKIMVSDIDEMKMVFVPSGEFLMGSNPPFPDDEQPQHMVFLDAYWIDQTEVTNAMYLLCVNSGACEEPNVAGLVLRDNAYANHPATFISWENANKYCNWAGRRLPSEAEWEKAARGIDGRLYPWGNESANSKLANFGGSGNPTKEVGLYPEGVSPFGAYDLAGNVSEWVFDWYGKYKTNEYNNPKGNESGDRHMSRGGSSQSEANFLRTAFRGPTIFDEGASSIGFRCAFSDITTE
jgi:formylglycine-generating enzyme required for sulfatase activity